MGLNLCSCISSDNSWILFLKVFSLSLTDLFASTKSINTIAITTIRKKLSTPKSKTFSKLTAELEIKKAGNFLRINSQGKSPKTKSVTTHLIERYCLSGIFLLFLGQAEIDETFFNSNIESNHELLAVILESSTMRRWNSCLCSWTGSVWG